MIVPKKSSKPRCSGQVSVGLVRLRRDVPLAAHVGVVAAGLQHLRDRHAAVVEVAGVALRAGVVGEDADAGLVRMQAGQQRGARRAAARGVVELREAQAVGGEAVEVGRVDLAAVAADVGVAHVVVEDQDDVRSGRDGGHGRARFVRGDAISEARAARASNRCAAAGAKPTNTSSPSRSASRRSLFSLSSALSATKLTMLLSPRSSTRSTRAAMPSSAMRRSSAARRARRRAAAAFGGDGQPRAGDGHRVAIPRRRRSRFIGGVPMKPATSTVAASRTPRAACRPARCGRP